jgi:predicted phosphodiesterase
MRCGVVSDIHGNLPALQAVVADAGAVDAWLNLGDILSGPLWPAETADWLMSRGWLTMAGNHERQVLTQPPARMSRTDRHTAERLSPAHRAWLAALPPQLRPMPGLLCVHGTPDSDLVYLLETVTPAGLREATPEEAGQRLGRPDASLLLCGHSHVPRDVVRKGIRVVNPGSVGLQAFDDAHPFDHVVENGSPHARYAWVESTPDGWQVTLRQVAYDWESAAVQAERHGRGDWADALRTGRVGRRENSITK